MRAFSHWSIPDPAAVTGTPDEIEHAFAEAFTLLERRISLFLALPFAKLEEIALRHQVGQIGMR